MHDFSVKVPVITFNRNDKTTSKLLERLEADPRFNKDVVKNYQIRQKLLHRYWEI